MTRRRNDGLPSMKYSAELADEVCALIAEGKSLRQITEMPGMPSRRFVQKWMTRYPDFREKYECAMMLLAEWWAHEIIDIADDRTGDFTIDEDGRRTVDYENIQRSRLRCDQRRWLLSKILPKRYGDRVVADVTVRRDVKELSEAELLNLIQGSMPALAPPDDDTAH